MITRTSALISIIVIFICVINISCNKENNIDSEPELSVQDSLLNKAKLWYRTNARSATPRSAMDVRNFTPQWNKFRLSKNRAGQPWISVPIKNNLHPEAYLTEITVVIDNNGQPNGVIKKFDRNPYVGNSPLTIYTSDGKTLLAGIYLFEKRKMLVFSGDQIGSSRSSSSNFDGLFRATGDGIREIEEVDVTAPGEPQVPNDGQGEYEGGGNSGGGGSSGGGGGGAGAPVAPPEEDPDHWQEPTDMEDDMEIRDSLQAYPCANSALSYMKQSGSKISSYFNNTFGGPQKSVNIAFVPRTFTNSDYDGMILPSSSINDRKVALSTFILDNSSKEYLLVTMYHEFWHGYMELERYRLQGQFNQKYPEIKIYSSNSGTQYQIDQEYMHGRFKGFIDLMKEDLKIFNPSLSNDVIEALVTSGIVLGRSNQMIILNQNERDTRNGNSVGSKCP